MQKHSAFAQVNVHKLENTYLKLEEKMSLEIKSLNQPKAGLSKMI
ncbi:hypothetical protein A33Q_2331 [Indibacter alkaliphilus LW1]|uniref:Uncharacterized protein n=1 Tax=Indibacter alkaliphilus (strain CCUG 57479 / KCTC 22604 / LW1) TaxID=1189612 RepID=S2DWX5_INDAL|nr:hypothetical protein A33Q_2331 [Indibacter alkaliphilus LW1]